MLDDVNKVLVKEVSIEKTSMTMLTSFGVVVKRTRGKFHIKFLLVSK